VPLADPFCLYTDLLAGAIIRRGDYGNAPEPREVMSSAAARLRNALVPRTDSRGAEGLETLIALSFPFRFISINVDVVNRPMC